MENETAVKKVMLSGIQPSGDLHLGNYLGAVKNWAALADQFECYYFMADLHTLTVRQNPTEFRRRATAQLAQYIACGLDPQKNTLFLQSHVHEHRNHHHIDVPVSPYIAQNALPLCLGSEEIQLLNMGSGQYPGPLSERPLVQQNSQVPLKARCL